MKQVSISLNIKTRPIRCVFLCDPTSTENLLRIIEINSALWGGSYNAIIPVFKRIPRAISAAIGDRISAKSYIKGIIESFDPDFIITPDDLKIDWLGIDAIRIIPLDKFLKPLTYEGTPHYGISLFEALNYFYNKEFKYVRRYALKFHLPAFNPSIDCFFASLFGKLPEIAEKKYWEGYKDGFDAEMRNCNYENFCKFLAADNLFVRRLSDLYIEERLKPAWEECYALFVIDPKNNYDIIEYWNLRALGWSIFPVPLDSWNSEVNCAFFTSVIKSNYKARRLSPDYYVTTRIIKSRGVSAQSFKTFIDLLSESNEIENRMYNISYGFLDTTLLGHLELILPQGENFTQTQKLRTLSEKLMVV